MAHRSGGSSRLPEKRPVGCRAKVFAPNTKCTLDRWAMLRRQSASFQPVVDVARLDLRANGCGERGLAASFGDGFLQCFFWGHVGAYSANHFAALYALTG